MVKRKDSRKTAKKKPQRPLNGATLRDAVAWAVDRQIFAHLKVHGNTAWQVGDLILLAVIWVWSNDSTLTGAFAEAHRWSMDVLGRTAVDTYQGFIKALATWTASWLPLLWDHLHQLMEEYGGEHWRVGRWVPLAVDGSRVSVPRTKDNEKTFCAPNFGKSRTAQWRRKKKAKNKRLRRKVKETQPVKPQIWVTLLWHMGLQMPWSWKTGPSYAAERDHFREMLREQKFPQNTLFCCDAGFTGYEFWKSIIDANHASRGIDLAHFCQQDFSVPVAPYNPPNRRGNLARRQRRRRHLIQERLKDEVIRPVDERHVGVGALERLCGGDPAESTADNYYPRTSRCVRQVSPRTLWPRVS